MRHESRKYKEVKFDIRLMNHTLDHAELHNPLPQRSYFPDTNTALSYLTAACRLYGLVVVWTIAEATSFGPTHQFAEMMRGHLSRSYSFDTAPSYRREKTNVRTAQTMNLLAVL